MSHRGEALISGLVLIKGNTVSRIRWAICKGNFRQKCFRKHLHKEFSYLEKIVCTFITKFSVFYQEFFWAYRYIDLLCIWVELKGQKFFTSQPGLKSFDKTCSKKFGSLLRRLCQLSDTKIILGKTLTPPQMI